MNPLDSKGINGFNDSINSGEEGDMSIILQSVAAGAVLYAVIFVLMAVFP